MKGQGHGGEVEPETAALQAWLDANPISFAASLQGGNSIVAYPTRSKGKCDGVAKDSSIQ